MDKNDLFIKKACEISPVTTAARGVHEFAKNPKNQRRA